MVDRRALGAWGEDLAVAHLEASGYDVLARNWRCREGELDIVAQTRDALVFVEVKTRSSRDFGEPAEAVSPIKARRIRGLAARWLIECRPPGRPDLRFDVVAIVRVPGQAPDLVHLEGAF
ncbi:MAG: yraN [Frankiales bacterium]|nr:yraN [Frankiales bacterium]